MENTSTLRNDDVDSSHVLNCTTDNSLTCDFDEFKNMLDKTSFIIPLYFGLIAIFGLALNIMTISVFVFNKAIRGIITNALITSLATADLILIVFCIPFVAIYPVVYSWPYGNIWCQIQTYLEYVCYFSSIYILALIFLDRYIALVHPIRAIMLRTTQNCYIALITLWSLVILGNIPFIFITEEVKIIPEDNGEQRKICTVQFRDTFGSYICLFMFAYMLPLIVLCVLYGHMLKVFLTGKNTRAHKNESHYRLQAKQSITTMAVLGMTVCAVCSLPLQIITLYVHVSKKNQINARMALIIYATKLLAYMKCFINPILYTFYSNTFRNGIKNMVCCRKTKHIERASYGLVRRPITAQ